MSDNQKTTITKAQDPNASSSVMKSQSAAQDTVRLGAKSSPEMAVMAVSQEISEVKEFVDNANVYTSISKITIESQYLIIYFTNGLTFNCGRVKGDTPVLQIGTVTTLDPGKQVTADLVYVGDNEEKKPVYQLNIGLPKGDKGDPGESAGGNVNASTDNLLEGRMYAFVPDGNGSANGHFEEIKISEAPSDGKAYGQKDKNWVTVVETVDGKGLSTNDFTNELLAKLNSLQNYDDTTIRTEISNIKKELDTLFGEGTSEAIDTFNEIENFLAGISDTQSLTAMLSDLQSNIVNLIPTKMSQLQNDADYVIDKYYTHTDNNFTNQEKQKLESLENFDPSEINGKINEISGSLEGKQDKLVSGTNIKTINGESILGEGNLEIKPGTDQQQVDWNESDTSSPSYIKNKPTIPTVDVNKEYVDSKIGELNDTISKKANAEDVNSALSGKVDKVEGKDLSDKNYTAEEKRKLAGIADGANKYVLPNATNLALGGVKIGNNITHNSGVISLTKQNVIDALGFDPEDSDSAINISSLTTSIESGPTISDEDLATLKEYMESGKFLYASDYGDGIITPISALNEGDDIVHLYYHQNKGGVLTHFDLRIDTYNKTWDFITRSIPDARLSGYQKESSYTPISSSDSIQTAIGKLEAGLESAGGSEVVVITHAGSGIPPEGDIVSIAKADHDKLVYAIRNNLEIMVRTAFVTFKAYGAISYEDEQYMLQVFFHFPVFDFSGYSPQTYKNINYINGYVDVPLTPNEEGTYDLVFHRESPYFIFDINLSNATEEGVPVSLVGLDYIAALIDYGRVTFYAKAPSESDSKNGLIMFSPIYISQDSSSNDIRLIFKSDFGHTNSEEYNVTTCYEIYIKWNGQVTLYKVSTTAKETGNITTHTHDTTYHVTEMETDVWDGTTISSSLSGSGTKDDPYLIQSCADWLHLYVNGCGKYNVYGTDIIDQAIESDTFEFLPVVKVVKNLDFDNKTIPNLNATEDDAMGMCWEFDCNNATISNFKGTEFMGYQYGCVPYCWDSLIHSLNIENIQLQADVSTNMISLFTIGMYDMSDIIVNIRVNGTVTINGEIDGSESDSGVMQSMIGGGYLCHVFPSIQNTINSKFSKSHYGFDIDVVDNTTKTNGGKLVVARALYYLPDMEIVGYDASFSNMALSDLESDPSGDFGVATQIIGGTLNGNFYIDSEKSNGIMYTDLDSGDPVLITSPSKTTTEMRSQDFVDILNSVSPGTWAMDPNGGYPILKPKDITSVAYDGYVKESELAEYKKEVNADMRLKLDADKIYWLPEDIYNLTETSTHDQILTAFGGEAGVKKIIGAIESKKILVIKHDDRLSYVDGFKQYANEVRLIFRYGKKNDVIDSSTFLNKIILCDYMNTKSAVKISPIVPEESTMDIRDIFEKFKDGGVYLDQKDVATIRDSIKNGVTLYASSDSNQTRIFYANIDSDNIIKLTSEELGVNYAGELAILFQELWLITIGTGYTQYKHGTMPLDYHHIANNAFIFGYEKANEYQEISNNDTINEALGKLERGLELKAGTSTATTSASGLMSSSMYNKLEAIKDEAELPKALDLVTSSEGEIHIIALTSSIYNGSILDNFEEIDKVEYTEEELLYAKWGGAMLLGQIAREISEGTWEYVYTYNRSRVSIVPTCTPAASGENDSFEKASLEMAYVTSGKLRSVTLTATLDTSGETETYNFTATAEESGDDTYYLTPNLVNLPPGASQEEIETAFGGREAVEEILGLIKSDKPTRFHIYFKSIESVPVYLCAPFGIYIIAIVKVVAEGVEKEILWSPSAASCYVKKTYPSGYALKPELYSLTSSSTSDEISTAVGGEYGLKEIIQAVKDGNRLVIRGALEDLAVPISTDVIVNAYEEADNGNMVIYYAIVGIGQGHNSYIGMSYYSIDYTKPSETFSCVRVDMLPS